MSAPRRGHWPRGKRRSAAALPPGLRRRLAALVEATSWREAGRRLRADPRTLRRWLEGEDWPSAERLAALERHFRRAGA